jgi:hypothetical protein
LWDWASAESVCRRYLGESTLLQTTLHCDDGVLQYPGTAARRLPFGLQNND